MDVVDAVGGFNMFSEFVSLGGRFKEIFMLEQRSFIYVRFLGHSTPVLLGSSLVA